MMIRSSLPNDSRYFPMLLVEDGNIDPATQLVAVWNKYKDLSLEKKNILTSDELPQRLQILREKFQIDINSLGIISILIRKLFFGEIQLKEMQEKISSILVLADKEEDVSESVMEFIRKEILTIQPKPKVEEMLEEKEVLSTVSLPLLQALSKYSQIGNQLITKERIKIKSQVEPVRPSLIYWLKYYRDELGVGHHDSVQRGQFLFRSENGKKLSGEERERVNLILKSIEENLPLDIDTVANEIVFPHFEAPSVKPLPSPALPSFTFEAPVKEQIARVPERAFPVEQPVPVVPAKKAALPGKGILSFSSPHVFQAEKEKAEPKKVPTFNANPFHIRPVSMQDDEEQNL